jgi:hypothetical protein
VVKLVTVEPQSLPALFLAAGDRPGRGQLVEGVAAEAEVLARLFERQPRRRRQRGVSGLAPVESFEDPVGEPFEQLLRKGHLELERFVHGVVSFPRCSSLAAAFVRTVRAECLDWLPILNRRHLAASSTTTTTQPHERRHQ